LYAVVETIAGCRWCDPQQQRYDHAAPVIIPSVKLSYNCIAVRKVATLPRELTCRMGSHSVTCHPAAVTFPPLPQPMLVLD